MAAIWSQQFLFPPVYHCTLYLVPTSFVFRRNLTIVNCHTPPPPSSSLYMCAWIINESRLHASESRSVPIAVTHACRSTGNGINLQACGRSPLCNWAAQISRCCISNGIASQITLCSDPWYYPLSSMLPTTSISIPWILLRYQYHIYT